MQKINNSRKFIAIVMVLIFSMTVYHNIHFDNIFAILASKRETGVKKVRNAQFSLVISMLL